MGRSYVHALLRRLAAEHAELQQALAGIRPGQFHSDEGKTRLTRVRILLRAHFSAENDELYPTIENAAQSDNGLAGKLKHLTDELRIVTSLAEAFFSKYEQGAPRPVEFSTDHGALLTIITSRMKREEQTVFPLFARLAGS
jgi:hypothetical protein